MEELYTYGGVGGRVSARQTLVDARTIDQGFTWNDLGLLASLTYPNDAALADPQRTEIIDHVRDSLNQGAVTLQLGPNQANQCQQPQAPGSAPVQSTPSGAQYVGGGLFRSNGQLYWGRVDQLVAVRSTDTP